MQGFVFYSLKSVFCAACLAASAQIAGQPLDLDYHPEYHHAPFKKSFQGSHKPRGIILEARKSNPYALPISAMAISLAKSDGAGIVPLVGSCVASTAVDYSLHHIFNGSDQDWEPDSSMVQMCGVAYLQSRYGNHYGLSAFSSATSIHRIDPADIARRVGNVLTAASVNYFLAGKLTRRVADDGRFSLIINDNGHLTMPIPEIPLAEVPLSGDHKRGFSLRISGNSNRQIGFGVRMWWQFE